MSNSRFNLSPLPPLGAFLVVRAQDNDELQAALDDGLADYREGTEVILTALRALLDQWLEEGQQVQYGVDQFLEPYKWLAITDHLEAVQVFRNLLGAD